MDLASSMAAELAGASYRAAGAEENASCDPSSSDGNASEGTARSTSGDFVYHRVTKLDTLAGLAIKYNITVSDIKRANGILSENAMFAREYVKIPTGQLPVGEEAQVLFARLMSGYGRDASLNAKERKAPGTLSITQLPGSPTASRCSHFGAEAAEDDPGTPYSRRSDKSSSEPGDVELMSLHDSSAYGYGSDRVRRRTKHESSLSSSSSGRHTSAAAAGAQLSHAAEAAVGWLSTAAAAAQAGLTANGLTSACLPPPNGRRSIHGGASSDQSSSSTAWHQISHAIAQGGSSLVQKIKRAASQPALAHTPHGGFGDVADAVLRESSRRLGSSSITNSGSHGSVDILGRGTGLVAMPARKDTKGD